MVFIVEDDSSIRELVLYSLKNSDIACIGFPDGNELFDELRHTKPDLILLDIMLPKEDGLSILKKIRENTATAEVPVIMLTAKTSELDKVVGLDGGADDYITKPFSIMELIARVKRHITRTKKIPICETTLSFENIKVNIPRHSVNIGSREIVLSLKEFDLLCFLIRNKNIVHSRETLLTSVWGYDFSSGETRTIDTHIMSLRNKLGKEGNFVQTIRGIGYKLGVPQ